MWRSKLSRGVHQGISILGMDRKHRMANMKEEEIVSIKNQICNNLKFPYIYVFIYVRGLFIKPLFNYCILSYGFGSCYRKRYLLIFMFAYFFLTQKQPMEHIDVK